MEKKKKELIIDKVRDVYAVLSAESSDGGVTPEMLLRISKDKESLLHKHFEWDNTEAGHQYRLYQARCLLNSITVEIDSTRTREFQNIIIETEQAKTRKYYSLGQILSNEDLKKKVLTQIIQQLRTMVKRYTAYKEVYQLVNIEALENLEEKLSVQFQTA